MIESVEKDENDKTEYTVGFTEYKGSSFTLPEQSVRNIARVCFTYITSVSSLLGKKIKL